ncbi:hypothetical protein [Pseudoalteromonas sp. MMG012]|uniref:hypothetical protein n=1 Tax=Pseudoalteromonas sp. MMG012 TaxID=2822686 RepID=UPI001B3A4ECF|nr:hypothetical protein [Pseudoalteromonas sp. MMG012]MBQ4852226.1 hypothetical protein [Pseudoalteromonas sp. MMG012]
MKKFLLLVIIILGLFTIDHPSIKGPRDTLLNQGIDVLSESSKITRSPAAQQARESVTRTVSLSTQEQNYINEALATDEKLREFHLRYCEENDVNLDLYAPTLMQVCNVTSDILNK